MRSVCMPQVLVTLFALKGRDVVHRQLHRFDRDERVAFDPGLLAPNIGEKLQYISMKSSEIEALDVFPCSPAPAAW